MRTAVIITTYQQPDWLEKVLWGYSVQTTREFAILIADDGSGPETRACIDRLRAETGLPITHVWHEDDGFRKCTILNKAIRAAEADYLIFTDGDCIPQRAFVEAHIRHARPGVFLSGGYIKLPLAVSQAITPEAIRANAPFDMGWLLRAGVPCNSRLLKFHLPGPMRDLLAVVSTTPATFNGMGSSVWREDALRVNGFDERMRYGGLDREFGARLSNLGLRGVRIRYHALCLHLDHGRGYRDEAAVARNAQIRREVKEKALAWTPYGIRKGEAG